MAFNDYVFIHKDSLNHFNTATNPKFIAQHTCCVAIEKETITASYDLVADFVYDLNKDTIPDKAFAIVVASDLCNIH